MKYKIPKRLVGITFGILSPDEIKKIGDVKISQPELYSERGEGFPGGPLDPRLGAPDNVNRCKKCGLRRIEGTTGCLGHFGHIELAKPIYHLGFVKHIEKVLNAVCERCGRLTLPPEKRDAYWKKMEVFIKRYGYPSFDIAKEILAEAAKVKKCPYCGHEKLGKFVFDKDNLTFIKRIEISEEELKKREWMEFIRNLGIPAHIRKLSVSKGKKKGKRYINIYYNPESIRQILSQIYPAEVLPEDELKERRKDVFLIGFHPDHARPEWTILQVLPVPPITVRPPVITAEGKRTEDQLTLILRDIIRINEQLMSKSKGGPPQVIENLWNQLQKRVKALFGLHKLGELKMERTYVKGIIHRLSGKEGRFRHNLSGKRVNYSGRAVISPDPYLSIDEIGVPEKMARKLLFPEVVNELNSEKLKQLVINGAAIYPGAEFVYKKQAPGVYRKIMVGIFKDRKKREEIARDLKPGDIVERHLMDGDILVFNRQPTLHRISMMGHYVRVLPYNTLRLHLMTCPPYNADFDGDEMNVHLPRSYETKAEIMTLMEVKRHIITARYGGPIIGPKQDFITGAYLLTKPGSILTKEESQQVLFYAGIEELPKESINYDGIEAYDGKKIFSMIIPKYIFYQKDIKGILVGKSAKEKVKTVIWNGELIEGVIEKGAIGAEKPENIVHKIVERWGNDAGKRFLNSLSSMIIRFLTDRGFSLTLWDIIVALEARKEVLEKINEKLKEAEKVVELYLKGELEPEPGKSLEDTFEDKLIEILDQARNEAGEIVISRMNPESQFGIMTLTGARGDETNIAQVLACIGQPVVRGKRLKRGYSNRTLPHFKEKIGIFAGGFAKGNFAIGMSPLEYFFHNAAGRDSLVDTAVRTADSGYFYRRLVNALQDSRIEYDGTARMMSGQILQFKYGGDGVHPGKSYHGKIADYESIFYELLVREEENGKRIKEVSEWPKYYDEFIQRLRNEISYAVALDVKELLKREFENGNILTEGSIQEFYKRLKEKYERAQIDPGEAAGTVAAQSICEPATQLTLRTFHWAGVAAFSITTGLPRLKEIFDAVEKPSTPMITVYLKKDYAYDEKKAWKIFDQIKGIKLEDIIVQGGMIINPVEDYVEIRIDRTAIISKESSAEDKMKTSKHNVSLEEIINAINRIGKNVRVEQDPQDPYVLYVYPGENMNVIELYKKLRNLVIKGQKEYTRAQIRKQEGGEYYILISSTELTPLLYMEGVDISRLETNNIHQFAKIFGIEAARRLIVKEARDVLEGYGLEVDVRHILYAADAMTLQGKVEAIGRYGIAGKKMSLLARASFEETGKHLFRAAAVGMFDPLQGATENVIVGGVPPVGTGVVRLGFMKRFKVEEGE